MTYPAYEAFLRAKMVAAPERGITIDHGALGVRQFPSPVEKLVTA